MCCTIALMRGLFDQKQTAAINIVPIKHVTPSVHYTYHRVQLPQIPRPAHTMHLRMCICVDLRKNSDYFPIQH
jgi:hypothetical protein